MDLRASNISCGIQELCNIGVEPMLDNLNACVYETRAGKAATSTTPRVYGGRNPCTMLIASVTERQTKAIKFLEEHGFKRAGDMKCNPNSGNNIGLWFAYVEDGKIVRQADPVLVQHHAPVATPAKIPAYAAFKSERKILRDKRGRFARRKPEQLSWTTIRT